MVSFPALFGKMIYSSDIEKIPISCLVVDGDYISFTPILTEDT